MNHTEAGPGLEEFALPGEEDAEVVVEKGGALALLDSNTALGAVDRAAIDVQINTAKQFPRSITKAMREAQSLACVDAKTAETMVYAVKRSNKVIEGPSVRLAEIMVYSFGNIRIDADIVGQDKQFVTAMGTCFDLEKNVATRIRVKRRITDKNGRTYNEDMIGVTANAAISIALRNAVFKTIPFSLTNRVYQDARAAMLGKGTLKEKREKVLEHFAKLKVKPDEIFAMLEIDGLDDLMEDQLVTLRGFANAIKEGEMSVESVFRSSTQSGGADELNQAIKSKAAPAPQPAKAAPSSAAPAATPVTASLPDCHKKCRVEDGNLLHHQDCKHFSDEATNP